MDSTFIIEEPLREEGVGVGLACSLENFTSSPLFSINKFHCSLKSFAKIPFNCRDIPCSLKLTPKIYDNVRSCFPRPLAGLKHAGSEDRY